MMFYQLPPPPLSLSHSFSLYSRERTRCLITQNDRETVFALQVTYFTIMTKKNYKNNVNHEIHENLEKNVLKIGMYRFLYLHDLESC